MCVWHRKPLLLWPGALQRIGSHRQSSVRRCGIDYVTMTSLLYQVLAGCSEGEGEQDVWLLCLRTSRDVCGSLCRHKSCVSNEIHGYTTHCCGCYTHTHTVITVSPFLITSSPTSPCCNSLWRCSLLARLAPLCCATLSPTLLRACQPSWVLLPSSPL